MLVPTALVRCAAASIAILAIACKPPQPELTRNDPPAGPGAMAPGLLSAEGVLHASWLEPEPDGPVRLLTSRFDDTGWHEPVVVATSPDAFANWADFPAITASGDGSLLAHWLRRTGTTPYAYTIELATSADGGTTWTPRGQLPDDTSATEHGFLSAAAEGSEHQLFWLDGREMAGNDDGNESSGAMTLRTARLTAPDAEPAERQLLDDRVCECCQTGAAWTRDGPIVVYRDRSPTEIRDISIVRRTPAGWSDPAPIHDDGWLIRGCPVNGPAVAADQALVAVAWFSAPDGWPAVRVAFSQDSGATFAPPLTLDDANPVGRVDLVLDDGMATIVWLARTGEQTELRLVRVDPTGTPGTPFTIAPTSAARASGFPRLTLDEHSLWIAWVEATDPSHIRIAQLSRAHLRLLGPG